MSLLLHDLSEEVLADRTVSLLVFSLLDFVFAVQLDADRGHFLLELIQNLGISRQHALIIICVVGCPKMSVWF